MRQDDVFEDVQGFIDAVLGTSSRLPVCTLRRLELRGDILECLLLRQDVLLRALLEGKGERVEDGHLRTDKLGNLLIALHSHSLEGDYGGDVLRKQVVFQVETAILENDSGARFVHIGG